MAPPLKWGNVKCANCGSDFRKRIESAKFCSLACRDAAVIARRPVLTCETCGKQYQAHVKRGKIRRYCSPECRQIGHRVLPTPENIKARFWANVDKRATDECWPWKLKPGKAGYGILALWKFKRTAHRISFEIHNGPIPDLGGSHGGCVLHRCDNRICVNPNHLFLGTQGDNMRDMFAKGRGRLPHG